MPMSCPTCPHSARGCAGPCACLIDGKDISVHKAVGYCPDGRFGTAEKPAGWDEMPVRPPLPVVPLTDEQIEEERRRLAAGGCCP
jgi:hypothetical protein